MAKSAKAKQLLKLISKTTDLFNDGDILTWQTEFNTSSKSYNYAAIKAGGKWYVTGAAAVQGVSLEQLTKTYFSNTDREFYELQIVTDTELVAI